MRTRSSIAAVSALALLSLTGAPAHAEYYGIDDPADASASLTDVYGMEAMHGTDNVLVKVRFNELLRSSAAGLSVFIDTDRGVKGPEYVLSSGLGDGTDYVLTEAVAWRGSDDRVDCDYEARPRWAKDVFRARISRDCFGDPGSVRVSVKMVDQVDGSRPVIDWAPKRHRWSLPIASGLGA
jgi:fructose-specific component phosphotransferase system IIB-like protein